MITLDTEYGRITGSSSSECNAFLGLPYATAKRFEYAEPVPEWENTLDCTKPGTSCTQIRTFNEHLEVKERLFFHNEFRKDLTFSYGEDCLNLNIFTPPVQNAEEYKALKFPVIVYIHGGGFNSGANCEMPFDGSSYAKRGIVTVFINYRVGIFGYLCHEEIQKKYNHDGNFGLDDQLCALKWIKENIQSFGGDSQNITVMGQSAGAISIQYLCLNHKNENLFSKAVMLSGAGKFPEFACPRKAETNRLYWSSFMEYAGISSFNELKEKDASYLFEKLEEFKKQRKDNTYSTMPCIDGWHLPLPVKELIKNPLPVKYMAGYTNNDMYAPLLAFISHKYIKKVKGYLYFFDVDAKGDKSKAFHSSDLNFVFGTLKKSWRPYEKEDYNISEMMQCYISNFVKSGNPNSAEGKLPVWKPCGRKALRFGKKIKMVRPHYLRLTLNKISQGEII